MSRAFIVNGLLCFCLLFVAAACGTHKSGYVADDYVESDDAVGSVRETTDDYDIATVIESCPEWMDVTISGTMAVGMGNSLRSAVVVKMIKDKSVSISIRPILGIEMGKIYFEGDTVTVVDKYHKAYLKESVGKVLGGYLDLTALQSLLLSYPFVIGDGALDRNNCDKLEAVYYEDGGYSIFPKEQMKSMEYGFDMDGNNIRQFNVIVGKDGDGVAYSVDFGGFQLTERGRIATSVKSNMPFNGVDAFFELDYKSVKWNNDVADSVTVPSGARRYAFSDIMKLISR